MIIVLDNYDSFVETLARYVREAGYETNVVRNDRYTVDEVIDFRPQAIFLSPGPGRPLDAGISIDLIRKAASVPIFGVCLGHQAIAEAYGGETISSPDPMHGRTSPIQHGGDLLFDGVPSPFEAGRYHSLLATPAQSDDLSELAWTTGDLVMAMKHRIRPHCGVQFHPESLLTPYGRKIIGNFLDLYVKG